MGPSLKVKEASYEKFPVKLAPIESPLNLSRLPSWESPSLPSADLLVVEVSRESAL